MQRDVRAEPKEEKGREAYEWVPAAGAEFQALRRV